MNTNPGRYAAALGAAMIALSLSLYVNPDGWRDAFLLPMAVFGAVLAVAAIAGALPELIRDYAHARLMWARNRHEAANLGRQAFAAEPAGPAVTLDNEAEAWRAWYIGVWEAIRDGQVAGPKYSNGLDAVMDYSLWKPFSANMSHLGILEPVTSRVETKYRAGMNAVAAIGVIRAASPLPYPVGMQPPRSIRDVLEQQKQAENSPSVFEQG